MDTIGYDRVGSVGKDVEGPGRIEGKGEARTGYGTLGYDRVGLDGIR